MCGVHWLGKTGRHLSLVLAAGGALAGCGSSLAAQLAGPSNAVVAAAVAPAPAAKPSPRKSSSAKPAPASSLAAPAETKLTAADQYRYDVQREDNRHTETLIVGTGKLVRDLAWPLVALVLIALAARVLRSRLSAEATAASETTDGLRIPLPGDFAAVASDDQRAAVAADVALRKAAAALAGTATPARLMNPATQSDIPPAQHAAFQSAQVALAHYFKRAFSSMQATQYQLLRALALRPLNYGDAMAYYETSVSRQYPRRFEDWLDLLTRFALVERQTDGTTSPYTTTLTLSGLGKLFVGWCDAHGHTDRSLEAQGRGF